MRKDKVLDTAHELMLDIKQQVFKPGFNVPSTCPECKEPAVNGTPCANCLTKWLAYIVGTAVARTFLTACIQLRDAEQSVIHISKGH